MTALNNLALRLRDAQKVLDTVAKRRSDKRQTFIAAETARIDADLNAEFGAEIAAANEAVRQATAELDAAKIEAGRSALDGYPKGILEEWRARHSGDRYRRAIAEKTGRRGVCEVCMQDTAFRAGASYSLPKVGDVFIRILKKDGSRSLNFDNVHGDWRPVEGKS